jgi:hypothetical protein
LEVSELTRVLFVAVGVGVSSAHFGLKCFSIFIMYMLDVVLLWVLAVKSESVFKPTSIKRSLKAI